MSISADATNVTLKLSNGDSAVVALQGATVHSYIHSGVERFFVSSKSDLNGPAAIRGGIPICWCVRAVRHQFGLLGREQAELGQCKDTRLDQGGSWSYVCTQEEHRSSQRPPGRELTPSGALLRRPIFGPPDNDDARFNKMKQHGFARTSKWTYDASASGLQAAAEPLSGGVKAVFSALLPSLEPFAI